MWSKLKSLWQSGSLSLLRGGPAYEVPCRCGHVARGWRQRTHQVLRCRQCGGAVFVLGSSPLPPVGKDPASSPGVPLSRISGATWRWLRIAGAGSVLVVVVLIALKLLIPSGPPDSRSPIDAAALRQQIVRGEKHLATGAFRQAESELAAARFAWQRQPGILGTSEGRDLEQLWRQATLLADLSAQTLEEILEHAASTDRAEWPLEFAQRYQGKAFVFDLQIQAAAGKHFDHPYRLWAADGPAQLDLDNLELLHQLPLDPAKRVLFAARLKNVKHEAGRGWVVQLAHDSGVLLTDAGAARFCCPALGDAQTQAVLRQQKSWLIEAGGAGQK